MRCLLLAVSITAIFSILFGNLVSSGSSDGCAAAINNWWAALLRHGDASAAPSFEAMRRNSGQELVAAPRPRLMRSTEAARLAATGHFSPRSLVESAGGAVWNRTRYSAGRFFGLARSARNRFADRRGASDSTGLAAALEPEVVADLTPAEFFHPEGTSAEPYVYYTSPLATLAPALHTAVDQRHFALSEDGGPPILEYDGGPLMRLSSKGSTCQCHWDSKHNIFVQLHGRKRFFLWPTEALPLLYLYPSSHASYPKSMLNFDSEPTQGTQHSALVNTALAAGVSVDLVPGDVLYIPPLTPHHVECLGSDDNDGKSGHCVGFNVFSTGSFSKLIGDIQAALARAPLAWLRALTPTEWTSVHGYQSSR
eukprot:SAG31_NODE_1974_length_6755_cov_6.833383_1_plen_367_part_00